MQESDPGWRRERSQRIHGLARPGAPPASIDRFIGKVAARDIARGEPL
jgi:hypothetical protein